MRRQGEIRDQKSSHAEGQEVSGEDRFGMFGKTDASEEDALAVAGKFKRPNHFFSFYLQVVESAEYLAVRNLHTPKGRRFQENTASICSERTGASEVQKIRMAEDLFCLFGVLVSK
jgi:hypothetical protein